MYLNLDNRRMRKGRAGRSPTYRAPETKGATRVWKIPNRQDGVHDSPVCGLVSPAELVVYCLGFQRRNPVPNIKSVVKDVKKSRKNHERNIAAKSALKTFVKRAKTAID